MNEKNRKIVYLTFDVEEYFQVENLRDAFPKKEWEMQSSRVEKNVDLILEILGQIGARATFFILGSIAKKNPNLIKKIMNAGHEIASHGYGHDHTSDLTHEELFKDIQNAKNRLEDVIGDKILGYRAPNFSVSDRVLEILKELDFLYDSSYNPFQLHDRYGTVNMKTDKLANGFIKFANGIFELPVSAAHFGNMVIPNGGGAYFRIFPYTVFRYLVNRTLKQTDFYHMYLHPWEFDPQQQKIKNIDKSKYFRHYFGLSKTEMRFKYLLNYLKNSGCEFIRIKDSLTNGEA